MVRPIEAQAAGTVADASSTVAVEAASGALSRAFASPGVVRAAWVQECLSPAVLAQMGRDLIRSVVRRRILTPWTPTMSIGWHADQRRIRTPNNNQHSNSPPPLPRSTAIVRQMVAVRFLIGKVWHRYIRKNEHLISASSALSYATAKALKLK